MAVKILSKQKKKREEVWRSSMVVKVLGKQRK